MRILIFPGYSPHNREWAYEVKDNLKTKEVVVHEWGHWPNENGVLESSAKFSLRNEIAEIIKLIGNKKVNIIAKSVGTRVTMHIAPLLKKEQLQKVVLCGIPTRGASKTAYKTYEEGLATINTKNLIIFQNKKDPLANYYDVEKFIHKINPKIKIVEKERSDHHYPYYKDFNKFLN